MAEYQKLPEVRARMIAKANRQRLRKLAAGGSFAPSDIRRIREQQRNRCAVCREKLGKYEVDHIIPIARGGSNFPSNLQLLCKSCNRKKSAKDPIDFMKSVGRLL